MVKFGIAHFPISETFGYLEHALHPLTIPVILLCIHHGSSYVFLSVVHSGQSILHLMIRAFAIYDVEIILLHSKYPPGQSTRRIFKMMQPPEAAVVHEYCEPRPFDVWLQLLNGPQYSEAFFFPNFKIFSASKQLR